MLVDMMCLIATILIRIIRYRLPDITIASDQTTWTTIVNNPLPIPHRKSVIVGYLQIIHRHGASHHLPARYDPVSPVSAQHMHTQLDLSHWQEASFLGEEGMLLVGVDDFALSTHTSAMLYSLGSRQRHIHQIVIMVEEDVQDGLILHLFGVGIIGQHLFAHVQLANWLFALGGADQRLCREATAAG